jgi:hypothetical protein
MQLLEEARNTFLTVNGNSVEAIYSNDGVDNPDRASNKITCSKITNQMFSMGLSHEELVIQILNVAGGVRKQYHFI